jgi:two-component system nitrate/nitrite response regulator NarL
MNTDIIVVSPKKEQLASWKLGLKGVIRTAILIDRLDILLDEVSKNRPEVMLLDFELIGMDDEIQMAHLSKLCSKAKVIITSDKISEETEWKLLKAGVKGCCSKNIQLKLLNQVIVAVQGGELWIRRSLTSRLIDELCKSPLKSSSLHRGSQGLLDKLTQREYDIALHVGNGESNKEIARSCAISERTVKAHLSEVFQKLGVSDRINLAMLITESDRRSWSNRDDRSKFS